MFLNSFSIFLVVSLTPNMSSSSPRSCRCSSEWRRCGGPSRSAPSVGWNLDKSGKLIPRNKLSLTKSPPCFVSFSNFSWTCSSDATLYCRSASFNLSLPSDRNLYFLVRLISVVNLELKRDSRENIYKCLPNEIQLSYRKEGSD